MARTRNDITLWELDAEFFRKKAVELLGGTLDDWDTQEYRYAVLTLLKGVVDTLNLLLSTGLRIPKSLDKESDLPSIDTLDFGDGFIVADMDILAPGHQGRIWVGHDEVTGDKKYYAIYDHFQVMDGVSITLNSSGKWEVDSDWLEDKLSAFETTLAIPRKIADLSNNPFTYIYVRVDDATRTYFDVPGMYEIPWNHMTRVRIISFNEVVYDKEVGYGGVYDWTVFVTDLINSNPTMRSRFTYGMSVVVEGPGNHGLIAQFPLTFVNNGYLYGQAMPRFSYYDDGAVPYCLNSTTDPASARILFGDGVWRKIADYIPTGAGDANVQADFTESDPLSDSYILNMPPTLIREIINFTHNNDNVEMFFRKVTPNTSTVNLTSTRIGAATTSYAGVMSKADKAKLDGIAAGATAQVQADVNVSDKSSPAYIKNLPANIVRNLVWYPSADRVDLRMYYKYGNAASGSTVNVPLYPASTTEAGVMTAADRIKLDSLTQPVPQEQADWTEADTSSPAFIKNKPSNLVMDSAYVHTDNNFTTAEKTKLANLNTDDALQGITSVLQHDCRAFGEEMYFLRSETDQAESLMVSFFSLEFQHSPANGESGHTVYELKGMEGHYNYDNGTLSGSGQYKLTYNSFGFFSSHNDGNEVKETQFNIHYGEGEPHVSGSDNMRDAFNEFLQDVTKQEATSITCDGIELQEVVDKLGKYLTGPVTISVEGSPPDVPLRIDGFCGPGSLSINLNGYAIPFDMTNQYVMINSCTCSTVSISNADIEALGSANIRQFVLAQSSSNVRFYDCNFYCDGLMRIDMSYVRFRNCGFHNTTRTTVFEAYHGSQINLQTSAKRLASSTGTLATASYGAWIDRESDCVLEDGLKLGGNVLDERTGRTMDAFRRTESAMNITGLLAGGTLCNYFTNINDNSGTFMVVPAASGNPSDLPPGWSSGYGIVMEVNHVGANTNFTINATNHLNGMKWVGVKKTADTDITWTSGAPTMNLTSRQIVGYISSGQPIYSQILSVTNTAAFAETWVPVCAAPSGISRIQGGKYYANGSGTAAGIVDGSWRINGSNIEFYSRTYSGFTKSTDDRIVLDYTLN